MLIIVREVTKKGVIYGVAIHFFCIFAAYLHHAILN